MQIIIPSSVTDKDAEFRRAKKLLSSPQKPRQIFCSSAVDNPPSGKNVVIIPSFRDCLDKNGCYSEDIFNKKMRSRSSPK